MHQIGSMAGKVMAATMEEACSRETAAADVAVIRKIENEAHRRE